MNIKKDVCDTPVLPDDIFAMNGQDFFNVIRSLVGEVTCDILQIQMIDSANNLLNTNDVFDIFKYDSEEIDDIKTKACFKMRNGEYIIRTGVLNNMEYLKTILKKKFIEQHRDTVNLQKETYYDLINQNPMLQALLDWYSRNQYTNSNNNSNLFMSSFVNAMTKNAVQPKRSHRYDDCMKDFALVLYILGAKQCYEFIRLNIIGVLPNLTTINKLISNTDPILTEGQFRFDTLKQYLDTLNVRFGFCAEDCTGVIKKVQYDVTTNSFIGFVTKLSNGVPVCNFYQTDSYEQLQYWFEHVEKASLLNIHMFQPIPQSNRTNTPASFLTSAYGVDSTSTAIDIIERWIYIYNSCTRNQIRIIGFSTGKALESILSF